MIAAEKLNQRLVYFLLFITSLAINLTLALLINPVPTLYDEFSYLIGADLLSQGKICAEQHPFWQHFESFMLISQPAYCSKYLPLQSIILALGQILFQKPIFGLCFIS